MKEVRDELSKHGIAFKAKLPKHAPFWCFDEHLHAYDEQETIEATFVDDTAIALVASSPKTMIKSVNTLLRVIISTYTRFGFTINFKKGKSEGIMRLRGKGSVAAVESLRKDGTLGFDLPIPYNAQRLLIVDGYKHFGSYVSANECLMYDAQHRASSALSA